MRSGKPAGRIGARGRAALVACVLGLLASGVAGCGSSAEDEAAAEQRRAAAVVRAREMKLGRRAFAEHCERCHTLAGKPFTKPVVEWEAPNLDEVRLKRHYVEYRVELGGPAMASFASEMSPAALRALITYVTETAGRNVSDEGDRAPEQVAAGRELFAEHCARCHGIESRAATGDPAEVGIDFNLVKPSTRFVERKVRFGIRPELNVMPPFRGKLADAEIEAVAAYVNAVAAEGPEAPETPFELE